MMPHHLPSLLAKQPDWMNSKNVQKVEKIIIFIHIKNTKFVIKFLKTDFVQSNNCTFSFVLPGYSILVEKIFF
jgi:hypothetical protein